MLSVEKIEKRTYNDMMRFAVEAAGRCWHDWSHGGHTCNKCGKNLTKYHHPHNPINPSPDDLNAVVELAEDLGLAAKLSTRLRQNNRAQVFDGVTAACLSDEFSDKLSHALLTAICKAIGYGG